LSTEKSQLYQNTKGGKQCSGRGLYDDSQIYASLKIRPALFLVVSRINYLTSALFLTTAFIIKIKDNETNKERTHLTDSVTDIFFHGSAGEIMPQIVEAAKKKTASSR